MAKKGKLNLLITALNNAIRNNHIKARINKTQQNSRCRLYGDRDKTTTHMISECSKLAHKEYKITYDLVGKVIRWELCKKVKFDHAKKWNICPEEWDGQTPLGFWDTNRSPILGQTTWPLNNQQKTPAPPKKTCQIVYFAVPVDPRVKLKEEEG